MTIDIVNFLWKDAVRIKEVLLENKEDSQRESLVTLEPLTVTEWVVRVVAWTLMGAFSGTCASLIHSTVLVIVLVVTAGGVGLHGAIEMIAGGTPIKTQRIGRVDFVQREDARVQRSVLFPTPFGKVVVSLAFFAQFVNLNFA